MKSFALDGRYDVIASGSLLGIKYKRKKARERHVPKSIPVGFERQVTMHSFDFEEFLNARGYGSDFVSRIYSHMVERRPFDALEEKILHGLFMDFCIVGGMPKAVAQAGLVNEILPLDKVADAITKDVGVK